MAKSKVLEFDRNGIPVFHGEVELVEEYKERARDIFYGRTGTERQRSSAIDLRQGTRSIAYDAVKAIPRAQLMTTRSEVHGDKTVEVPTIAGVEKLHAMIEAAIQKEKPIRTTELFDKVFYASTVWRAPSAPMRTYLQRREDEFNELNKISETTTVSEDIQAWLLLRFSGVPADQHPNIVA